MKSLFSPDSPVMRFLSTLVDLMLLNLLWLVCSLPVITIGASTTACYYVCLRLTRGEAAVAKDFFRSFRQNFKQATFLWLILLAAAAFLAFDFYFLNVLSGTLKEVLNVLLLMISAVCIFAAVYVFPLQAQFDNSLKKTLQNALQLSFRHFWKTILMVLVFVLIVDMFLFFPVVALRMAIIWLLFLVSGPVYLCCCILKPVLKPYLTEPE